MASDTTAVTSWRSCGWRSSPAWSRVQRHTEGLWCNLQSANPVAADREAIADINRPTRAVAVQSQARYEPVVCLRNERGAERPAAADLDLAACLHRRR